MQTVVETPSFIRSADKAGMTPAEREAAIGIVSANPAAGDIIAGGGGIRKVRVPMRGKGKSGGYRVLTYFMQADEPVFLLWVLVKSKQANLSDAQTTQLRQLAKEIRGER
ncbi:type II toxin-antitoxin system RelE/ParE family toxin [Blastomonas sp.]|uniref:type II toxin-antitoxin system RelE/ParE family toxin n=1 Tax=Blastomonas sp. TaxID=1909299 RepID=UPI00359351E8